MVPITFASSKQTSFFCPCYCEFAKSLEVPYCIRSLPSWVKVYQELRITRKAWTIFSSPQNNAQDQQPVPSRFLLKSVASLQILPRCHICLLLSLESSPCH